jgi:hypothetical protein
LAFVLASYLLPGIAPSSFPQKEVRTKLGSVHYYGSVSMSLRRFWVDCRQDRFRRSG